MTTASNISPLKGLNTTHWYFTGNVTNPVPSRINPFPIFSIPVIATTKPCLPLHQRKDHMMPQERWSNKFSLQWPYLHYINIKHSKRAMITPNLALKDWVGGRKRKRTSTIHYAFNHMKHSPWRGIGRTPLSEIKEHFQTDKTLHPWQRARYLQVP